MKVVILCGGQGTRLREETEVRPKPMVEIGGRPILWHIMKIYAAYGLTDFVLCLGYKGHQIKDYFYHYELRTNDCTVTLGAAATPEIKFHRRHAEDGWTVTLAETGEKTQTGARIHRAAPYFNQETFCLTYGDGVGNIPIDKLLEFHRSHGKIGTVTGVRPPGRFGELEISGHQVTVLAEKPQVTTGMINGGFFVFEPQFIEKYLRDDETLTLESEPLQRLAADGELMVFPHTGFWQLRAAQTLHDLRVKSAAEYSRAVETSLKDVALERARFEVRVTAPEDANLADENLNKQFSAKGFDQIEFYFSANVGESLKPIARVASGGEASRLMLVLKTTGKLTESPKTAVFDEIDVGISGRVAEAVGRKLKQLAEYHQVLCVTHQPQVAALASTHFVVQKEMSGTSTTVEVVKLDNRARVEELARMLTGATVTETARKHAKEMLKAAA